jgi:predicted transcriptional regulator
MKRPHLKLENFGVQSMRQSKLEIYVDILKILAHKNPLKLTDITYKSNFNSSIIKEYLDFLIKHNLVEEQKVKKKRSVFVITQRGITVLKYFGELTPEIFDIEQ